MYTNFCPDAQKREVCAHPKGGAKESSCLLYGDFSRIGRLFVQGAEEILRDLSPAQIRENEMMDSFDRNSFENLDIFTKSPEYSKIVALAYSQRRPRGLN